MEFKKNKINKINKKFYITRLQNNKLKCIIK